MIRTFISALTILILCGASAYGQHGAIDETIDTINKLLGGKTIVSFEKEELIVKVYRNEKLFRRDRAYVTDLNADATEYLPDEWSIVLRCTRKAGDCVDKRLYVHKKRQQYSRLTILIKGNEGVKNELIDNFKKLVMLCQE
jgi:hypothetical protein